MSKYKITKVIDAGFYTKDGEKVMDLAENLKQELLGLKITVGKEQNESNQ